MRVHMRRAAKEEGRQSAERTRSTNRLLSFCLDAHLSNPGSDMSHKLDRVILVPTNSSSLSLFYSLLLQTRRRLILWWHAGHSVFACLFVCPARMIPTSAFSTIFSFVSSAERLLLGRETFAGRDCSIFSRLEFSRMHVACTFRLFRLTRCNKQEPPNHYCTRERTRHNTSDRA